MQQGEERMDLVFSTDQYAQANRYAAWRDAICDVYVHVDVKATNPDRYRGFIRETKFGDVVMTDILLSEQRIRRSRQHISQLDKDCYYVQLVHTGSVTVSQRGEELRSNAARGAIFSATEQYELRGHGEVRSFYLELPREAFAQRFPRDRIPVAASLDTTQGLGRIATEFCASLASEGTKLDDGLRADLGSQLMDMLALTLQAHEGDVPEAERWAKAARLRLVQRWIEEHIADPELTLDRVAAANGISLRYLHMLFESCDMSASEWIWDRRLQLAYDGLAKGAGRTIISIAMDHGFNSPTHFTTRFRRKYGVSPRDVARSA
jgi:AraC-like DNA-binding protein